MTDYNFDYTDDGPYGSALRLLGTSDLDGQLVIDIGCGSAAIAHHVRKLGGSYVGLDIDQRAVSELIDRGHEAHVVDVADPKLPQSVREIVGNRSVAALTCLDVLEHVAEPASVLTNLTDGLSAQEDVELIVSIPNVAHIDVANKLLCGRWETTDSGLLDRTHLRFFTSTTLTTLMSSSGWYESEREDFQLQRSDQHAGSHPIFSPETNIGMLLTGVRSGADPYRTVNQFVRRYHRGAKRDPHPVASHVPFLSVVVRTLGDRQETLEEALCCLAAQTDLDFEVLVVVHGSGNLDRVRTIVGRFESNLAQRVRTSACDGGTRGRPANVGLQDARGEYIAFLDDDDLVTADWVQRFHESASLHPGMLVRSWAAEQQRTWADENELAPHYPTSPLSATFTSSFDLVRHIRQNETPFHCFAFPATLVDLGYTFNERVTVCEDWDFLIRAASLCGVADTGNVTSIYHRWSDSNSADTVDSDEWNVMRSFIHIELDRQPLVLPPGSIRALDRLGERVEEDASRIQALEHALADANASLADHAQVSSNAHAALDEIRHSTSWRMSAPVRGIGKVLRQVLTRVRR